MDAATLAAWAHAALVAQADTGCHFPVRRAPDEWEVKGHRVRRTGPGWWELSCDCRAGHRDACAHRAWAAQTEIYLSAGAGPVALPWGYVDPTKHSGYSGKEAIEGEL